MKPRGWRQKVQPCLTRRTLGRTPEYRQSLTKEVKRSMTHSSILALPARDEEIPNAMEFIEKIMGAAGFSPRKVMEVQLAVAEALMNIINHSYHGGDGMIDIISDAHEDGLVVTLKDEGSRFDPTEVKRGLIFLAM